MFFSETNWTSPLSEIMAEIERLEAIPDPYPQEEAQLQYLKFGAEVHGGRESLF